MLTKPDVKHSYVCRAQDLFARKKRYQESSVGLVNPCEELFAVVHSIEHSFRIMLPKPSTVQYLYLRIYPECDFLFLFVRHPQHAQYLSQKITKLYITMRTFYAVKFFNQAFKTLGKDDAQGVRRSIKKRKMQKILHK